jgi:GntR family transcriptional regulator
VRQLAVDLSVNLNTVAKAYREMEIRGIVDTQQGTGTFVSTRRAERKTSERRKALEGLVDRFVSLASSNGFSLDELAEALTERAEKMDRR